MTNTKHTPGPWQAQGKYGTEISGPKGTYIIADLGRPSDPEVCELMQADARLIAAAPELLAALEEIARRVDPDGTPELMHRSPESLAEEAFHIARAAIARARGDK